MPGEESAVSRWPVAEARSFARDLFSAAGLDADKASTVATVLLEGDLMGHATHGLALAPRYLEEISAGSMARTGDPDVVSDRGACVTWNGRRLPGVWLTARAVDLAMERAPAYGTVTVAIGNSHHIGCLAAYLPRAIERGLMALIATSDPSQTTVAPFGGRTGVFTPNPIAAGIPTGGTPILVDTSASITTNNMGARLQREGRRFPHPWLLDAEGQATDDPSVLKAGGTIMTAGGLDHGQKGYGWALLVEALTQGLAGFGRAEKPTGWGASVFVQVIDPAAFAGLAAFERETGRLADACAASLPRPGVDAVRLPGSAAMARREDALRDGVALAPSVVAGLRNWAARFGIAMPA
jgi:L-lactate dehydrogenase